MSTLSRRSFLFASAASLVALGLPSPALAAPSRTIVLDTFKDANGVSRVRIPTDLTTEIGVARNAELVAVSERALKIAQTQNLTLPKANGLLTRMAAPVLRARAAGGVAGALLQAGLMVGLTVALAGATAELSKDSSTLTMNAKDCANLPVNQTSDMWQRSTGIYRNGASGTNAVAVQSTTGVSAGGTIAAPAGWSWAGQRNATSIGNGQFRSEVQFTRNVACGERVAFPPTVPQGSIPGAEHGGNEVDQNSAQNRAKVVDGMQREAQKDQETGKPIPGGEDSTTVQEPGITIPAPGASEVGPPIAGPDVPGSSYIAPRPGIGNEDTRFTFAPGTELGNGTTPTPTPTPAPTPSPTPTTGTDWGEPPTGTLPTAPAAFSWVPTPWATPSLPGSCTGLPYNFATLRASGSINPCPAIDAARPIVRPIAVAGWTAYAVTQFLDL